MVIIVPSSSPTNFPKPPSVYRVITDNQRRLAVLERNTGLRSAAIGAGGLRIYDMGSLLIQDGGDIEIEDGGNIFLREGGNLFVQDGGNVEVEDGGDINVRDDGEIRVFDEVGDLNTLIGRGILGFFDVGTRTGVLGEFTGQYWDIDAEAWVSQTVRGMALYKVGTTLPFFSVGHALGADRLDMSAGYGGTPLESIDFQATHFAVRTSSGGARISMNPAGSGNVVLEAESDSDTVFLGTGNSSGRVAVNVGGATFEWFNIGSHATPANLSISANVVRLVSSAAKYKTDIRPLHVDTGELFAVSGKTYLAKSEVDDYERQTKDGPDRPRFASPEDEEAWDVAGHEAAMPEPPTRYPGFIADEWAAYDTLRQFVRFEDGQPEGFHYDRVTVAHHEVLKVMHSNMGDLQAENRVMRKEIAELKDQISTLRGLLST